MKNARTPNRRRRHRTTAAVLGLALVLAACGGEASFPEGSFSVVANSDIGTGQSRLQIGIIGPEGERLGSPDEPISVEIAPATSAGEVERYEAEWMWLIEDVVGLYKVEADITSTGIWTVSVIPENGPKLEPGQFQVLDPTFAPSVGDLAPVAPIDTLANKPLVDLTTDPEPDEDFYQMTMEQAFSSGKKSVVVFSTPAWCRSSTCGPTLNIVKDAKAEFPDANYIHVEVYTDLNAPDFSPTIDFLAPSLGPGYWNLPSEPWVFVVDEQGVVAARFEGSLTTDDIRDSLG